MADSAAPPNPLLDFQIEDSPEQTIVYCSGKIVGETCAIFQDRMRSLLTKGKCVVVDLGKVSFIDSAGLGALVGLWSSAKRRAAEVDIRWKESRASSRDLKVVNPNDRVMKLLRLTRLDKLLGSPGEPD